MVPSSAPLPRRAGAPPGAVLVALTPEERSLFFGEGAPVALPPGADWVDPLAFGPADAPEAPGWAEFLAARAPAVVVTAWRTPALPAAWVENAACPLRYVCHVTGSVRKLVPRSFIARGGLVTNWGAIASRPVAEHALMLAILALRNGARWADFLQEPPLQRRLAQLDTRSLFGRRVGIHGFGAVARALLPLLRPFDVAVHVHANVPPNLITAAGAIPEPSLARLFAEADVLFECEALTPDTAGCVSADLLARMQPGATFVNVARGGLVDEPALLRAAADGRLRVAVDVACDEPIDASSPILRTPGVIVSPHIGGPTLDHYRDCGRLALANLHRFLTGEPLEAVVTAEVYDRST